MRWLKIALALVVLLGLYKIVKAQEITSLRVYYVTSDTATIEFDIDPVVDVKVEIQTGEGGFEHLFNTGLRKSHKHHLHQRKSFDPDTTYLLRLTPDGGSAHITNFRTRGVALDKVNRSIVDSDEYQELLSKLHETQFQLWAIENTCSDGYPD